MKIFDRMTRLVRADVHGVMDQLEERSLLLKQHLREAELELERKRTQVALLAGQAHTLRQECQRANAEVQSLDEDVQLALSGDKEELARFALRRLIPLREELGRREARLASVSEEHEQLEQRRLAQEAEFEELSERVRARIALLEARERSGADDAHRDLRACLPARVVAEEEVEIELLRRRGRLAGEGA